MNADDTSTITAAEPAAATALVAAAPVLGLRRWLYVALGGFFVVLAFLGAILPVLPCTPFLLLASYFFVRSSPTLNRRLVASPLFGPMIRDWQKHRGVRMHVKVTALSIMPLAVGSSAYFGSLSTPLLILLCVLALIGMIVVMRLPLVREEKGEVATVADSEPQKPLAPRQADAGA